LIRTLQENNLINVDVVFIDKLGNI